MRFWKVSIGKIADGTGRGVVTFISNRKWLGGRSYPTIREALVRNFDAVVVDDLHGSANDLAHPGDGSVFTTGVASGIKIGTAIVRRGDKRAHSTLTTSPTSPDVTFVAAAPRSAPSLLPSQQRNRRRSTADTCVKGVALAVCS